nr:hypothetical protein KXZ65_01355 [Pectobacterium sp. PL152]WED68976.1 hypothetical protein PJ912_01415 [Pectobacterium colocasium]
MEKEINERLKNERVSEEINKKRRALIKSIAPMTQIKDGQGAIARSVSVRDEINFHY